MRDRLIAMTRQLTGTPFVHHAYVFDRSSAGVTRGAAFVPPSIAPSDTVADVAKTPVCFVMHHAYIGTGTTSPSEGPCAQVLLPGLTCRRGPEKYVHQPCRENAAQPDDEAWIERAALRVANLVLTDVEPRKWRILSSVDAQIGCLAGTVIAAIRDARNGGTNG